MLGVVWADRDLADGQDPFVVGAGPARSPSRRNTRPRLLSQVAMSDSGGRWLAIGVESERSRQPASLAWEPL
jgi:hypothetical protein